MLMKKCKVKGCNCKARSKGYCSKHYAQILRYGKISRTKFDPNEIVEYDDYAEIVLYNKDCEEVARALIDLEDIDRIKDYKWRMNDRGYVLTDIKGTTKKIRLHRLIMDCPDDMVVDHINHNRLDNRKENLRVCTQHQNLMNKNSVGVTFDKRRNKWYAQITYNYNHIFIGSFDTKEDAIKARRQAEIEYFGEYRNQDEDAS